ncbi:HD domain-containing protein [bacterium]|nr:HD domain-containing protein [bacterium]
MQRTKTFVAENVEKIAVLLILIGTGVIHCFVVDKLPFLSFYYLPVLIAAWGCGRRTALLISVLAVLLVALYAVAIPANFDQKIAEKTEELSKNKAEAAPRVQLEAIEEQIANHKSDIHLSLVSWGSFLILAAALVGTLYEQKEKKAEDLRQAYVGILEMLTKCLECTDRHVLGHSQRVAELAMEIARELNFSEKAIEKVKVGGLLHDIGKVDVSLEALQKTGTLSKEERAEIQTHPLKGAAILRSAGEVLRDVVPIVRLHHQDILNPDAEIPHLPHVKLDRELRLCIGIIEVADAYDAIVSDRPYRSGKLPWQALEVIEDSAGTQFDPEVVEAFKKVIARKM